MVVVRILYHPNTEFLSTYVVRLRFMVRNGVYFQMKMSCKYTHAFLLLSRVLAGSLQALLDPIAQKEGRDNEYKYNNLMRMKTVVAKTSC